MRSPYDSAGLGRERARRWGAWVLSLLGHVGFAAWLVSIEVADAVQEVWVEMAVVEKPPPPEQPPPPEPEQPPEPERPKPKAPEVVKFQELTDTPPPPTDTPPPPPDRPVRRVQGLSASSFAEGSGSGLSVRAGNTTAVAAGQTMSLEEAQGQTFTTQSYAAVTVKPRMRTAPPVEVPPSVIEKGIEGTWTVLIDIDATGAVTAARMAQPVGDGVDEACVAAWLKSRWKPGMVNDQPVAVTGIPQKCTIKALDGP